MDVKTFKALVKNLAALGRDRAAGRDLERLEEVVRREVEGVFKKVEDALREVKTQVSGLLAGVKVAFVGDVEAGLLYHNFVVVGGAPRVKTRAAGRQGDVVVDVVTGGVFGRLAGEVLERLGRDGLVVLVGPHGVGKSTLAAYAAWLALWRGAADAVVSAEEVKTGLASALENLQKYTGRRFLLLYDPVPVTAYYEPRAVGEEAEKEKERVRRAVEETLRAAGRGIKALVVLPDELYRDLPPETKQTVEKYVVKAVLNDVEFLHEVVMRYSGCGDGYKELAEKMAQLDGGYTLVAKYAGLWLRDNGCKVESVERAVEEAKSQPKLFLANYIWHVLLRGNGDLARRVAVPLLLHAVFGPVPVGVTYITKAVKNGVWHFLKPEELQGASLESLREDELEPIAKWLAQRHEDLVEETLRDLAGLNGEEARETYREALRDLIRALDWARDEVLKEGGKILAEVGIPKEEWILRTALWAFVNQRLAAVFKSGEGRRCWRRAVLIAGHALAGYPVLSRREQSPKDVAETLGDALKPCAVDDYLTIDGKIPWLSIDVVGFLYYIEVPYARDLSQIRKIRKRLCVLTPFADVEIIKADRKTVEELLVRWGKRDFWWQPEVSYALGLAALAAEAEVDGEMADLLLYAATAAVQRVAVPVAVLPVLEALRPLGEKAPHRYVVALAAASELETLDHETVEYIYVALQQLKTHLLETERNWPLVNAVATYSNLLRKHSAHIKDHWEEAVANMCELYSKVRGRSAAAAPESNLSAHRLFDAVARAHVLTVALGSGDLAQHVQRYCDLGDLIKEAEAVKGVLDEAAAHLDELRKIMESNADFAEWVIILSSTGDIGFVIENLRGWFTYVLADYKLDYSLDERGELDEKKLEETAEEFEKAAEMHRKQKRLDNYLIARGRALRTRVLAAKSWEELLERAKGFLELWKEAEKHLELTARYLATAAHTLGEYLVYLAASGDKEMAEELLKKWRWLLDYYQEVSVATRLMLKVLGVGEGARLEEVVDVFGPWLTSEYRPALWLLAGYLQKDEALEICKRLPKSEVCVDAVVSVAGDQEAAEKSKLEIKSETPGARPLRDETVERTLVEVRATTSSLVRLAFMLLAAVEGGTKAVRIHGLLGSLAYLGTISQLLFNAVYENCGDLNSEGCRLALLKLYYHHY
jgi:hypothetical protein